MGACALQRVCVDGFGVGRPTVYMTVHFCFLVPWPSGIVTDSEALACSPPLQSNLTGQLAGVCSAMACSFAAMLHRHPNDKIPRKQMQASTQASPRWLNVTILDVGVWCYKFWRCWSLFGYVSLPFSFEHSFLGVLV